jgi:2-phosphoglycerate kinase
MAKIIVVKIPEGDRSPFLRGILVQSLVDAGIDFADAYDMAQVVRNELQDVEEITSHSLKERVAILLGQRFGDKQRQAYESRSRHHEGILVHTPARSAPFSIGILAHSLETCAIAPEMALQGASRVLARLRQTGHREIDHKALRRIIYRCLHDHCSPEAANRYLSWRRFENSGASLIVMIGGTTGSGKSSLASELAYRMNISRIQSTDMMREIIRSYLSPQLMPTLGYRSFEAWRGLPGATDGEGLKLENRVVSGFLSQFSAMKPALEATVQRAIREPHNLILEGVHVLPTELELEQADSGAIIIPLMLATMKKSLLRKQLKRRGRENISHETGLYLEKLDDIWELQSWLLTEADRAGIHIIQNWYIEDAVHEVLELVSRRIMKHYPPHADGGVWEH